MALPPVKLNDWIYIYYVENNYHVVFDRTMARSAFYFVDQRVKELRKQGKEAFYTIGATIKGALS